MNILFIQTDQQRRDSLPCYGNPDVQAPHIDRLAAEGVVFDNAFTTIPLCAPARASMLVGKRPIHHGILYNVESGCVAGRDFFPGQQGFAPALLQRGYRCFHVGKWHIGSQLSAGKCGFEGEHYPGYGWPAEHPHYLRYLREQGLEGMTLRDTVHAEGVGDRQGPLLSAIQEGGEAASVPYYLADEAISAIRAAVTENREFFVACDFWGPHAPYILPEEYMGIYDPKSLTLPDFGREGLADKPRLHRDYARYWGVHNFSPPQWAHLLAACYGYVSLIDAQVGRMLACLEELGIADQTAVVFTSDHGGMVGSHGLMDKGPFLYDEVVRIPMIIRLPGVDPAPRREERIVYNMDVMPTFLELAEAAVPEGLDAVSLKALLQGHDKNWPARTAAYSEYHGHQAPACGKMIRTDRAKYIFNACGQDEFYDLHTDPHECRNLIDEPTWQEDIAQLRAELGEFLHEQGDPILRFYHATRG